MVARTTFRGTFRPRRPRRVLFTSAAAVSAAALTAGTAWACPPEPDGQQTRVNGVVQPQGEGRDLGGHGGHVRRDVGKTSATVSDAIKGVQRVGNVPDAKEATSLIFMDYGK